MNYLQARDEIYASVNTAWNTAVAALVPAPAEVPNIVWPGEAVPEPDSAFIYAQPDFTTVAKSQATLRRINGKSLFEANGLFTLRIFAPKSEAAALDQALVLAQAIESVLSKASTSGRIWYRNAKHTPVAGSDTMNQINVLSTCTYYNEE